MGIIKNWKKDKTYDPIYQRNHIHYSQENKPYGIIDLNIDKVIDKWIVEVQLFGRGTLLKKSFKTKALAMKYAVKYMRSHPRG